ncbi:cytochrome b-c1 complex subunit 8 [Microdochium bolleyi]|uniref:Cytochrome b-c1 complex subunit 8 n=1 Tax=Microdochium bolleyi TaxID=196109 RepID=A0A136IKA1_9PEZI|nr:cytochrome b-c1 complex subunit 8 [Microdochium bolleyi]
MRPTGFLSSSELPIGKYGHYLNKDTWGNLGCVLPQKGIISFSLSPNVQKISWTVSPSNGWRRFRYQVLYWAPPLIAAWYLMEWANERNRYLNSKEGRKLRKEE